MTIHLHPLRIIPPEDYTLIPLRHLGLLNLITPSTDQTHRSRPPNHLSHPPLVLPSQPRLRSRLDLTHLRDITPSQIRVDGFVHWVYAEDVERVGLTGFRGGGS
jgi:hypothetical protein